jgi:hypothetical protein
MPPTPEERDYINNRWSQLNGLSKEAADRAINLLFLTNAGGAIATLSFLGAVEPLRQQWAPKAALFLFILGVILVGTYTAFWVHHVEHLGWYWRRDSNRFFEGQITWQTLNGDDDERAYGKTTRFYVVGYLSFGCLFWALPSGCS